MKSCYPRIMVSRSRLCVLAVAVLAACSDSAGVDALVAPDQGADAGSALPDVGSDLDAAALDGGELDGGEVDAGELDGGTLDAAGPDTGIEPSRPLLIHGAAGEVSAGSLADLTVAIDRHADVKIAYLDWILRCTDTTTRSGGASCTAWMPVTVVQEGPRWAIAEQPDWMLASLDTSGVVDHADYRADRHVSVRNARETVPLSWFARDWRTLRYAHTDTGTAVRGGRADLLAALRAGELATPFAARPAAIRFDGVHVAALQTWRVSLVAGPRAIEITDDATQTFEWLDTRGALTQSAWAFAGDRARTATVTRAAGGWWAEPGWRQVLAHTESGTVTAGTVEALVADIEAAAEVMVQVGDDLLLPCQRVVVTSTPSDVRCVLRDTLTSSVGPRGVGFTMPVTREPRTVSIHGTTVTDRYLMGATAPLATRTTTASVRWFTNRAAWSELYATGVRGVPASGRLGDLVEAAGQAADIRLLSTLEGGVRVLRTCHSLKVNRIEGRVGCVDFDRTPGLAFWTFAVQTTDGNIRDYRVCAGTSDGCGTLRTITEGTRWFARR